MGPWENASSGDLSDRAAAFSLSKVEKMASRNIPWKFGDFFQETGCLFTCGYLHSQQICWSALVFVPQLATLMQPKVKSESLKFQKSINQLGWLGSAVRICILSEMSNAFCLLQPVWMSWSMLVRIQEESEFVCVYIHISLHLWNIFSRRICF